MHFKLYSNAKKHLFILVNIFCDIIRLKPVEICTVLQAFAGMHGEDGRLCYTHTQTDMLGLWVICIG